MYQLVNRLKYKKKSLLKVNILESILIIIMVLRLTLVAARLLGFILVEPGSIAQSAGHLFADPGVTSLNPIPATYLSCRIISYHSTDSRKVVVTYWQKFLHLALEVYA